MLYILGVQGNLLNMKYIVFMSEKNENKQKGILLKDLI